MAGGICPVIQFSVSQRNILHQITLHAVNHLDSLRFCHSVGKRLHHTVIGDSHGRMAPGFRRFDEIRHIHDSVDLAHLRMCVQLDPLSRRVVTAHLLFRFFDALSHDDDHFFKIVILTVSLHADIAARADVFVKVCLFLR